MYLRYLRHGFNPYTFWKKPLIYGYKGSLAATLLYVSHLVIGFYFPASITLSTGYGLLGGVLYGFSESIKDQKLLEKFYMDFHDLAFPLGEDTAIITDEFEPEFKM